MADGAEPHDAAHASRSGIVIVVVTVLIAVVVLAKGYGSSHSEVDTTAKPSKTTTTLGVTTTSLAGRTPAEVKVKAVNATNTQGLAGKVRDALQGRGYTQVAVGDATTKQLQSDVFYLPGWEAEAQAVARALGVNATNVRPMPEPPPISPGDATVLVMAGTDLA